MERLILLRHGKAEVGSPSGEDFDRGLTERGLRDSALIGRALAEAGFAPDLALVSAAARTRQTWQAAEPAFSAAAVLFLQSLYHAAAEEILALAKARVERTVMVIGHNPGLHQLCLNQARQAKGGPGDRDRLNAGFPTAAACVFELEAKRFALFTPKALGA
jgi:phosphohistidine phosphatase